MLKMKKVLLILIMTAITGSMAMAQNKGEEKELSEAVDQLRVAMIEGNRASLESLAAEELSYGHSGGHVEGKTEFIEKIVSGRSDFVRIELSNQTLKVIGNTAIVRHDLLAATNDNGKPGNVALHVLSVWQKTEGQWKMLARQAVKTGKQ
jgi:hypothetical protein